MHNSQDCKQIRKSEESLLPHIAIHGASSAHFYLVSRPDLRIIASGGRASNCLAIGLALIGYPLGFLTPLVGGGTASPPSATMVAVAGAMLGSGITMLAWSAMDRRRSAHAMNRISRQS